MGDSALAIMLVAFIIWLASEKKLTSFLSLAKNA